MDPNAERNGIIDVPDIALFSVAKVSELEIIKGGGYEPC
jgi:hypothetical protein